MPLDRTSYPTPEDVSDAFFKLGCNHDAVARQFGLTINETIELHERGAISPATASWGDHMRRFYPWYFQ